MKVILNQNVDGLGKQGDIVNVKDGFARNYLFPKNIAFVSTPQALKRVEALKKRCQLQLEKEKEVAQKLAKDLANVSCTISVEATPDEKLYGSITKREIADAIKSEGFEVEEKNIILDESLKALGIYEISIKLHPEVIAKVKLWIVKK